LRKLRQIFLSAAIGVFSLALFASCNAEHIAKSQGLVLNIPDDIYPLIRIETSTDRNNIFRISELGSIEAAKKTGQDAYGAGWIFTISKVSEKNLQNMLQNDMSGMELFACKDNEYYLYNHPTDVRYIRENNDIMRRDQSVWTNVNGWAYGKVREKFIINNQLRPITADNSGVGIALAKVMYDKKANATITSLAAGKFKIPSNEAEKYLKDLVYDAKYQMTNENEPNGEYIVINLPKEMLRLKFYYRKDNKNYISQVYENSKPLVFTGDCLYVKHPTTEIAKLYQALADRANKPTTHTGDVFIGAWHESIAGRGHIDIKKSGDNYKIDIKWGESAFSTSFWNMTAKFKNGALIYNDCEYKSVAYDEKKREKVTPHYKNGKGEFKILPSGELIWNDAMGGGGNDSVFWRD